MRRIVMLGLAATGGLAVYGFGMSSEILPADSGLVVPGLRSQVALPFFD